MMRSNLLRNRLLKTFMLFIALSATFMTPTPRVAEAESKVAHEIHRTCYRTADRTEVIGAYDLECDGTESKWGATSPYCDETRTPCP